MAEKIGLNVGSGQRPFKSVHSHRCPRMMRVAANMLGLPDECSNECVIWLNIDSQEKWKPEIICDGANLIDPVGHQFPSNHVDYVVLHHVLEHFGCGESAGLIKEAHRVLKPGGSLFILLPDMRALALGWLNGRITTQIYMTNVYGAYMGNEDDRHKWGFVYPSLEEFVGNCALWSLMCIGPLPKETFPIGADIAHDWWILEMECVK